MQISVNKRGELRDLFRKWVSNKHKLPINRNVNLLHHSNINDYIKDNIRIYFYEWSNVRSYPICFYDINVFEAFLKGCKIPLSEHQKNTIEFFGCVFISCYEGTKSLSIRSTYKNLCDSLRDYNAKELSLSVTNNKGNGVINLPKIIFEEHNTMIPNDGSYFG